MYHACQDHANSPTVNSVIILSVSEVEFRSLIVGGCHFSVVFLGREVILTQTKVNKPQFLRLMIDQHVERLDVSMHHTI